MGYKKEEEIAIISTSILGAYAIVRGISVWSEGFPSEKEVYTLAFEQEWSTLKSMISGIVYLYLVLLVVLSACGMYVQFKYFYDGEKKEESKSLVNNE